MISYFYSFWYEINDLMVEFIKIFFLCFFIIIYEGKFITYVELITKHG